VYDRVHHRVHCLEPLLARVWLACDGRRTPSQIASLLEREGAPPLDADLVALGLRRLRRARLIEPAAAAALSPPSRRELLLRAAALGGLGLLTITAPTALQAATCTPIGLCDSLTGGQCTGLPCCNTTNTRCSQKGAAGRNCGCEQQ